MRPMPFYERREWKELRFKVLHKYGYRCMACGVSKSDGAIIQVDHIKCIYTYPELALTESNLQVLCRPCNLGKSNKIEVDLRPRQEEQLGFVGKRVKRIARHSKERRKVAAAARLSEYIKKKLREAERAGDRVEEMRLCSAYLNRMKQMRLEVETA